MKTWVFVLSLFCSLARPRFSAFGSGPGDETAAGEAAMTCERAAGTVQTPPPGAIQLYFRPAKILPPSFFNSIAPHVFDHFLSYSLGQRTARHQKGRNPPMIALNAALVAQFRAFVAHKIAPRTGYNWTDVLASFMAAVAPRHPEAFAGWGGPGKEIPSISWEQDVKPFAYGESLAGSEDITRKGFPILYDADTSAYVIALHHVASRKAIANGERGAAFTNYAEAVMRFYLSKADDFPDMAPNP